MQYFQISLFYFIIIYYHYYLQTHQCITKTLITNFSRAWYKTIVTFMFICSYNSHQALYNARTSEVLLKFKLRMESYLYCHNSAKNAVKIKKKK